MTIIILLDLELAKRKVRSKDLAAAIGITPQNLSLIKNGKVKGVSFNVLAKMCEFLECQPGDLLTYCHKQ
jgi:putative transcriptional regulator